LLLPVDFIGLAEHTGLIKLLGLAVLDQSLRHCRAWSDAGLEVRVAVNISMRNLHDAALPAQIEEHLSRSGVAPRLLQLEVTESSIMSDPARVMGIAAKLADMGVGLSIDDFGTGYSSLAYLKRLPVEEIKIDKSFVLNMATDENDAVIARSIIDLAHNLGLRVVAEGVESEQAKERLVALGCDEVQGFWLARPMPAATCFSWLQEHQLASIPAGCL
jgi:diguanylate cyclase